MMYAVITGDVVNSSQVEQTNKNKLIASLREAFDIIGKQQKQREEEQPASFDIFRGDSFQGIMPSPADALKAGLLIRSALRKNQPSNSDEKWDARTAIGIGSVDHLPKSISEGDGPAYRNSGPVLDELKGDYRFAVTTPWQEINQEFKASSALLDAVIAKWTGPQAEIIWLLLQQKNAKTIAGELDISQAAVHYRVKGAGWFAIETMLRRFEDIINDKI